MSGPMIGVALHGLHALVQLTAGQWLAGQQRKFAVVQSNMHSCGGRLPAPACVGQLRVLPQLAEHAARLAVKLVILFNDDERLHEATQVHAGSRACL